MDLLALFRTMWRHKLVVIPVLVIVLFGMFYVLKVKPPTYQSDAEIILVNPPAAPTAAQIQADPKLAKINTNNPYLAYGDLTLVGDAVVDRITSHSTQTLLAAQGVSPKYQAAMSSDPGNPPIIDITGVGTSAAAAINSATLVAQQAKMAMLTMQQVDHVTPTYMIQANLLLAPTSAQNSVSSKLRDLIAVIAVGVILLFIAISIAEAVTRRREEELDIPPAKASRPYSLREEPLGVERAESTQEFSSPFLSSGARRPLHSLSETRSALPTPSRRHEPDLNLDDDDDDY
jgi:capsular polysaccharide biosynthesis protein